MDRVLDVAVRGALVRVLSTLALVIGLGTGPARAHEVMPAIADMERQGDVLTFEVRANVEGFVAGINLSAVSDTNEAPAAADYDSLRALEPEALQERFGAFWPQMAAAIAVRPDGHAPLPLELVGITVDPVGDLDLPRTSTIRFAASLPPGAEAVTVGWDAAFGALVLRQQGVEEPYNAYLEPGATSALIALAGGNQASAWETFLAYIPVGVDHIVPLGLDHILFVLGLFFLAPRIGILLWQVSAFTLAHTITLALAALGYVSVPGSIVEPLIAASIVYVAVENIARRSLSPWRPAVIFGFGLLHGLGFASVLAEFGLPDHAFIPALIGFNIGVELGQLLVIAVAFACVWMAIRIDRGADGAATAMTGYGVAVAVAAGATVWAVTAAVRVEEVPLWLFFGPMAALFLLCLLAVWRRDEIDAYRRLVSVPASAGIALVGAWWVVERVFL